MVQDIIRFAILGLGAGAIYGLVGLGIVVTYRGAGVVNFAAGAIGMVGAFVFYDERHAGPLTAWAFALAFAVIAGYLVHLVVTRLLARAPAITRLIATLAIFTLFFTYADHRYGQAPRIVDKLLDDSPVHLWHGVEVGSDRIVLLALALGLTAAFTFLYRSTAFGRATTAVAESPRVAAVRGLSPNLVAGTNWIAGSVIAVVSAILVVNVAGLSVTGLALLVVPALAAALLGGFRSLPLTLLGGLLIGVLESEMGWLQSYLSEHAGHPVDLQGWVGSIPFLVIAVVMVVRGRSLPIRSDRNEHRPFVSSGRVPQWAIPVAGTVLIGAPLLASDSLLQAITLSAATGIVLLSVVVVTGFAGQLSLAQFAFAGFGGWAAAWLVSRHGAAFPVAAIAGVAAAVPVGVAVGLPSLRARGVNLAVVTLALALVVEDQVFNSASLSGGLSGLPLGHPTLAGFDIDATAHPARYTIMALVSLFIASGAVLNLRRSRVGRRLLAVRANERAAASLGINVFATKLYAFGVSAGIAALGGILLVFTTSTATFIPTFATIQSIFAVLYVVIGGVGFVLGALIGGFIFPGGAGPQLLGSAVPSLNTGLVVQLAVGVGVLLVLWRRPNGLAYRRGRHRPSTSFALPPAVPVEPVRPRSLVLDDVTVRFGAVTAIDCVSLEVKPGEILGLLGPNGAGKTTLIDAITGFVPASGRIAIGDEDVRRAAPDRRAEAGASRTFQSLELFESMTIRENLATAAEPRDRRAYLSAFLPHRARQLPAAATAAIHELGLEEDLERLPAELSAGRRRLVAIARALARRPSVLLLDEPAAGLDVRESTELAQVIRKLAAQWGMAVIVVEHDVDLVTLACDRVLVIDNGRMLASGPATSVLSNPDVIAAYLGESTSETSAARAPLRRTGKTLLEAHGLSAGYGDIEIVRNVDLTVAAGEIVALLGPNGAGKTTLLMTLAGDLAPQGGTASVLGHQLPTAMHRLVRSGVGVVPEERGVTAGLTCADNLRLVRGGPSRAIEVFPELAALLDRPAGLLSGGEQQMIAIGLALAVEPSLLLIDELSFGLAPQIVRRLLEAVRTAADRGTGVLLVEQHAGQALRVADRCMVLRRGRVVLEGSSSELHTRLGDLEELYLSSARTESQELEQDVQDDKRAPAGA